MSSKWKLKRTQQCLSCPHRLANDPLRPPRGYRMAQATIAIARSLEAVFQQPMLVMSCHETRGAHCVGWLVKQHGAAIKLHLRNCSNVKDVRLKGDQHE